MIRAATWVAGLAGTRRALFAVLMGALSVLAFAPLHVWPVLFVTFGALTWLLDGCHSSTPVLARQTRSVRGTVSSSRHWLRDRPIGTTRAAFTFPPSPIYVSIGSNARSAK